MSLAFNIGQQVLKQRGLGIVGICSGNSWYTREKVQQQFNFGSNNFSKAIMFLPDYITRHNYLALGYTEAAAMKSSNQEYRIKRNLLKLLCSKTQNCSMINWEQITQDSRYVNYLSGVFKLYDQCSQFQNDINEMTEQTLKNIIKSRPQKKLEIKDLREGTRYILKQFGYLGITSQIHNVKRATFVYHESSSVFEKWVQGQYDGITKENLGLVVNN